MIDFEKGKRTVVFSALPQTVSELSALPQAAMQSPYDTAALFISTLGVYNSNKDEFFAMVNVLKGPSPLTPRDIAFFTGKLTEYLARSYFAGATPQSDYMPSQPFTVTLSDNPHSYAAEGHAKLFVQCGGADSPRAVTMRLAKDGKWYLTEYSSIMLGIRKPESSNPWA